MKNFLLLIYTSFFYFLFEITNTIVSFVDYSCAATFLGNIEVAAMGVNSVFFSTTALVSGLVFVGTEIICSNKIGQGSTKEASSIFSQMIIVAFGLGIVLLLLCFFFSDSLVYFMSGFNNDALLLECSSTYLRTMSFGIPVIIMTSMMISFVQLNNKAFLIPISSVAILLIDLALNIIFCRYFNMGIFGLALASVISMLIGFSILLLSLRNKTIIKFSPAIPQAKLVRDVFKLGLPLASRRVLTIITRTLINFLLTTVGGTLALSAYAFADCTMYLFSSVGVGLSSSIMLLASYSLGERNLNNLFDFRKKAKILSIVVFLILCCILWILSSNLALMVSDYGEQAYSYALFFIRINAITLLISNLLEIERNFLQVIKKLFFASAIVFLERCIVLIPVLIILTHAFGVDGIGGAYFITDIIVLIIIYFYEHAILHINDYVRQHFGHVNSFKKEVKDVASLQNIDCLFQDFYTEENIDARSINVVNLIMKLVLRSAAKDQKINASITIYLLDGVIHLVLAINDKRTVINRDLSALNGPKEAELYRQAKKDHLKVSEYNLWGKHVFMFNIPIKQTEVINQLLSKQES